jgi:8-oxo-dGTP pyrophosphatase MutT (NUDIX family)
LAALSFAIATLLHPPDPADAVVRIKFDHWPSSGLSRKMGPVPSLPQIEQRLAAHRAAPIAVEPDIPQAAVAIILRERIRREDTVTDVLFIRRAEKKGDPWSGHMAFPGGHREQDDDSLLAAALRETAEEIGLRLAERGTHIGTLDPQQVQPRMRPIGMLIAPFVFKLSGEVIFRPNHEVAEVVWTPLAPILRGDNHTEEDRIINGAPVAFGGYRINGGHFVWGLTYRMLHSFFTVLEPGWRPPQGNV